VAEPLVSVVVSTYNRPARLARLLDSLRCQALTAERFEVIVVDNGSSAETAAVLDSEQARGGLTLRTVRHAITRGPAAGRNSGWRIAQAPAVAFTDDDCIAGRGWLAESLDAAARNPGAIVQGRTLPDPSVPGKPGLLDRTVRIEQLGPQFETCNILYPRHVLESLDGFDEGYGIQPAGEDTDLAWRAIEAGVPTVYAPDAVVYHAVERAGVLGSLRIAARWSAVVRLFAAHPRTRSMLYRRVFWNVWHFLLWRSLLALPAPPWLRRLILMRHLLALRTRSRRAGAGSWAVPYLLIHDAVECWAIARGAVRYRTLVL
jgi:GT2 family glycosyltransferase